MTRRIARLVGLAVSALVATTVLAAAMPAQAATVFLDDPIAPVGGSDPARKVGVATIGALASFDNIRIEDDLPPIDNQPPTPPACR